jgi:deoxyribonuclease (pyrimidine dimer)
VGTGMTRINVVPPVELTGKHLVAEYRELPRVFGLVRSAIGRGLSPADIAAPSEYTLGPGHIKFFYTRLLWLAWRHGYLVNEMIDRGYEPKYRGSLVLRHCSHIGIGWWGDYEPTAEAMAINRARIAERLKT